MTKPMKCEESHLRFLDLLRESGVTNMFGAAPYLVEAYDGITLREARDILSYWMKTFSERHKEER